MAISTALIKLTNHIFPKVVHPFNLQNQGAETYAHWQYRRGGEEIPAFLALDLWKSRDFYRHVLGKAGSLV